MTAPAASEYKVGYKRPPQQTRFKKGQSGNPKGRPKGSKSLDTILREIMTENVLVRTARGPKSMSRGKALLLKYNEAAFAGSPRATEWLLMRYSQLVPDEAFVTVGRTDVPAVPARSKDMDAHDRAILKALRAELLGVEEPEDE